MLPSTISLESDSRVGKQITESKRLVSTIQHLLWSICLDSPGNRCQVPEIYWRKAVWENGEGAEEAGRVSDCNAIRSVWRREGRKEGWKESLRLQHSSKRVWQGVPWWHSRLRIWCCHCCSTGLIPVPGNFHLLWVWPRKREKVWQDGESFSQTCLSEKFQVSQECVDLTLLAVL